MKRSLPLICCILAALSCLHATARDADAMPAMFNTVDQAAMNRWVDSIMATMSPSDRIAQLFVMAIDPRKVEDARVAVDRYVTRGRVGGLIFSEGTINNQATITNYAQQSSTIPLMISADAEWGLHMRLKDALTIPRNLYIGAIDDDRVFYQYGREVARQCKRIGIHVNFAPVLDVNDNPNNPVIGDRSFGEDPDLVARHAIAYARGLEDGGVIAVGKHFPGHGSASEDSHKTLPTIKKKMTEINTCELVPFRRFVDAGLSGILTAHLLVPAIDGKLPTSMSPACVTNLLRNKMHFGGLIFTDALGMQGAQKLIKGSPAVNALLAGNDVLLMPDNLEKETQAIADAITAGTITQAQVDEHCRRILQYKYMLGLTRRPSISLNNIVGDINSQQAVALQRQLTASAITVIKNNSDILPIHNLQSRRIAVVALGGDDGDKSMFHNRCASYADIDRFHAADAGSAQSVATKINSGRYNVVLVAACADNAAVRQAVSTLAGKCKNVVLVITSKPYDIQHYGASLLNKNVKAIVLTYDTSDVALDYAAQTIFGGNAAAGRLPVTVKIAGKKKHYPAGSGIFYKATRLGYDMPSQQGLDNRLLAQVDSVCRYGIAQHAFPGCQVVVGRHGKIVVCKSYGETDYGSGVRVDDNTIYGLASVSKATGTLSAVMKVYDDGKLSLDEAASRVIPGLRDGDKADITFRDLLYHETGMPASLNMWYMMMDTATYSGPLITNAADDNHSIKIMNGAYGHNNARLRTDILSTKPTNKFNIAIADGIYGGRITYDSVMQRIYHAKLGKKRYLYSCLNFSLLADAVQRITHSPLNYFVNNYIFAPLGAYHTLYRPLSRFPRDQIAYTEVDTYLRRQHIHGYVHDELAAFSGGVQGNAGLFSSANDLAKLLQMWLNGGTYGGTRFYKASTVATFTTQKSPNSHRGLGFDKPVVGRPEDSNTCPEATPATYGHTGFTGTCFWVDPTNDMFYIFLSNRVSPTRNNPAFSRISARSHIHTLIYRALRE